MIIKEFEVKLDAQMGAPRFREKVDNRWISFTQFMFLFIVVVWQLSSMAALSILELWLRYRALVFVLFVCLFVWLMFELHATDERTLNDFLIGKRKVDEL